MVLSRQIGFKTKPSAWLHAWKLCSESYFPLVVCAGDDWPTQDPRHTLLSLIGTATWHLPMCSETCHRAGASQLRWKAGRVGRHRGEKEKRALSNFL